MKNFCLIGAAGYVAPRHMAAIKDTGNRLIAAMDKFDSVGIIDRYFPEASFFIEYERFDRHLEKLKSKGLSIDFLSICTPNYLHDAHIRFGLRHGMDVICEKPVVLNPWNLDSLKEIRDETGKNIFSILQLRLHQTILALKKKVEQSSKEKIFKLSLTYISSRGKWYYASWKADQSKSGGIATNIGVHFFDMLIWIFGPVKEYRVHIHTHDRAAGILELERAEIKWFLSINKNTLPEEQLHQGKYTYRSLTFEGEEIEFSKGFEGLHTESYQEILAGRGFGLEETRPAIKLIHAIRNAEIHPLKGEYQTKKKIPLDRHPFLK